MPAEPSQTPPAAAVTASPVPSQTLIPPEATGWEARQVRGYPIDLAATAVGGGTIHGAFDDGDGSVYQRSTDRGRTWDRKHRLPGLYPSIATAGDRVYIAFRAFDCDGGIGLLRNQRGGAPADWSKVHCLSQADVVPNWPDRDVPLPTITATGSSVYVGWLDARSRMVIVDTSNDAGRTFARTTLGKADFEEADAPSVVLAADGETVAVSGWVAVDGTLPVRVSRDTGRTWAEEEFEHRGPVFDIHVRGDRLVARGSDDGTPWVQLAVGRDWGMLAGPWSAEATFPLVALGPAGTLGALTAPGIGRVGMPTGEARWRTSADEGATWLAPERVPMGCEDPSEAASEESVTWLDDGQIVVLSYCEDDRAAVAIRP